MMSLPQIDTFTFSLIVPSTGQRIDVRPYLVKEEKILLMAQTSTNPSDYVDALSIIIDRCTFGQINPRVAPYFDIEYLLLQLRAKSVGEFATPLYECHNVVDETPCGHATPVKVSLLDIQVQRLPENFDEARTITIDHRYRLKLQYPTMYHIHNLVGVAVSLENRTEAFMEHLTTLFDELIDVSTSTVYNMNEVSLKEKMGFLESLSPTAYDDILRFLDTMPTVEHTIEYTCERCQYVHTLYLSGVVDFLG